MRKLNQLSELEKQAVVSKGLEEGVKIFIKAGKSSFQATKSKNPHNVRMAAKMAAKRGGGLAKSFSTFHRKKRTSAYAGFKRSTGGGIAHMVDRGTGERYTSRGFYRGSVSAGSPNTGSRFWTNAVQNNGTRAINELMDSVEKSVKKILNSR